MMTRKHKYSSKKRACPASSASNEESIREILDTEEGLIVSDEELPPDPECLTEGGSCEQDDMRQASAFDFAEKRLARMSRKLDSPEQQLVKCQRTQMDFLAKTGVLGLAGTQQALITRILDSPVQQFIKAQQSQMDMISKAAGFGLASDCHTRMSWILDSPVQQLIKAQQSQMDMINKVAGFGLASNHQTRAGWVLGSPAQEFLKIQRSQMDFLTRTGLLGIAGTHKALITQMMDSPAQRFIQLQRTQMDFLSRTGIVGLAGSRQALMNDLPRISMAVRQSRVLPPHLRLGHALPAVEVEAAPIFEVSMAAVSDHGSAEAVYDSTARRELSDLVFTKRILTENGAQLAYEIIADSRDEALLPVFVGMLQMVGIAQTTGAIDFTHVQLRKSDDGGAIIRVSPGLAVHVQGSGSPFALVVVDALRRIGRDFEERPQRFQRMEEEELRDHVISLLNVRHGMLATAETLRGRGKTDIRIVNPLDSQEVIVVECKFWCGEEHYSQSVDQLLDYQTGRERCAILLCFAKRAHFSRVSDTARQAVKKHVLCVPDSVIPVDDTSYVICSDWRSTLRYSETCTMNMYHLFFNLYWREAGRS